MSARGIRETATAETRRVARRTAPWIEKVARAGYFSKGVVYCLVGYIAFRSAIGHGWRNANTHGAFRELLSKPLGGVLLSVVGAGLIGYAIWQTVRAVLDPEHPEGGPRRTGIRIVHGLSALVHLGLAAQAFKMVAGRHVSGGQHAAHWTALLMDKPFGVFLVAANGAGFLAFAAYQFFRGFHQKLDRRLQLGSLSEGWKRTAIRIAQFGIMARGASFGVIGWFLLMAAHHHDPNRAEGLSEALHSLSRAPYGRWLLMIVSLGLMGYGIYDFILARYRSIRPV